jgi:hypothetical protein
VQEHRLEVAEDPGAWMPWNYQATMLTIADRNEQSLQ